MDNPNETHQALAADFKPALPASTEGVTRNPWSALRQFTDARVALGRAGISQPSKVHLDFQLAHAQARDAVHRTLDLTLLAHQLGQVWPDASPCLKLHSAVTDRQNYLQRPDLGRRLDTVSQELLRQVVGSDAQVRTFDLALVVADGLSALAIENHAAPFLAALRASLAGPSWRIAPLCVVQQARVAIGDEIGQLLRANAVVVLIGERPGLSSPDSMGLYMTWMPEIGLTDARRNCISNIRAAGLSYAQAARTLQALLEQSRLRQVSGVDLKDESLAPPLILAEQCTSFLLG